MDLLAERVLARDVRGLSRAISWAEEDLPQAAAVLRDVYPSTGRALVVGVTGAPGSGKSTLVDRLVRVYRGRGRRVGVVAVDPSSAFSGGAILGDRVRMQGHASDPEVFIRSMATRGHLGGLSRGTNDAIDLLDAAGYDPILIETVGVGQDEIDVVRTADVVAVVLVPGMGDDIQAIKAGLLEIADLFVINKCDRDGADRLQADLESMLSLVPESRGARPSIHRVVAVQDQGVDELCEGIDRFVEQRGSSRRKTRRRERAEARFLDLLADRLVGRLRREAFPGSSYDDILDSIAERRLDPYSAAEAVLLRLEVR